MQHFDSLKHKIMEFKETLGIDVSKNTLDVFLHNLGIYDVFDNNPEGYLSLVDWLSSNNIMKESLLVCFENTGLYSKELSHFLYQNNFSYVMENALQIKRSVGIVRGKSDKIDASIIARYAFLRRDKLPLSIPTAPIIESIHHLLTLRDRLVKQRAGYKASLKEVVNHDILKTSKQVFENLIKILSKEIKKIEAQILEFIKSDQKINDQFQLICSIKGIGFVAACYFIVTTRGFERFKNHRKFASYCGIAPFKHQSGTSIKGKTRVSHLANKKMKSLLNMTAIAAINHNKELKKYYQKRIQNGKNKMSTINIIRNKIVSRVFAVINRNTPYVELDKFAA